MFKPLDKGCAVKGLNVSIDGIKSDLKLATNDWLDISYGSGQFLKYIKITPKENAKTLQDFWLKQNKENENENLNMKVVK